MRVTGSTALLLLATMVGCASRDPAATFLAVEGSETIHYIAPFDIKPYQRRCEDLGWIGGIDADGSLLRALIEIKNHARRREANVIVADRDSSLETPGVSVWGYALRCPKDLLPAGDDAWATEIRQLRATWKAQTPFGS